MKARAKAPRVAGSAAQDRIHSSEAGPSYASSGEARDQTFAPLEPQPGPDGAHGRVRRITASLATLVALVFLGALLAWPAAAWVLSFTGIDLSRLCI
jgi:hypothetical protein